MSALTNPADERRIREIVRDELAALQVSDAPLKTGDRVDDHGESRRVSPRTVSDFLLGELGDLLHKLSSHRHVGGDFARESRAEVVGSGRDAGSVAEGERPGAVEAAPAPGHPIKATFELAPDDAATVLDWIRGTEGGAE